MLAGGGVAAVRSGALAQGGMVSAGGLLWVSAGGVASAVGVRAGGLAVVASGGSATAMEVAAGGGLLALPGAHVAGTVLGSGASLLSAGVVLIDPGLAPAMLAGVVSPLAVTLAGLAYVLSGGVALSAVISGGGQAFVYAGGVASGALVAAGASLFVSGGAAYGTRLAGGLEVVGPGGAAIDDVMVAGVEILSGGVASGGLIGVGAAQIVSSAGMAFGAVIEGTQTIAIGGTASDSVIEGGRLVLELGGTVSGFVDFAGGGTLAVEGAAAPDFAITGWGLGDEIDLDGIAWSAADTLSLAAPGVLTIAPGVSLEIVGAVTAADFSLIDHGGTVEIAAQVPCFVAGTRILTPAGDVPVEALRVGDSVITLAGEEAPVIWVGRRTLALRGHKRPETVRPVRIARGSFGPGVPARDLSLSPDHAVFYEGVLVPAKVLINHANIRQEVVDSVTYYHVELPAHAVMFAEGCPVESYLDTGNRGAFAAAPIAAGGQVAREYDSCVPLAESGPVVAALRRVVFGALRDGWRVLA